MNHPDDPDKKPPPEGTVAWDPEDIPGLSDEPAQAKPPAPLPGGGAAATQRLPVHGEDDLDAASTPSSAESAAPPPAPDSGATMMFTPEDVAQLEAEKAALEQAEEDDPLVGTLLREKWKVLKRLGAGSFGTVYKVQDMKGGWIEALKILGVDRLSGAEADEMRARFLREAQIMKRLGRDSKHIVGLSTYEEDFEAGMVYFLMEFVEGGSLADAVEREGPFTVERTVRLALQVCDALMAAHEGPEPVVHRDLKLENLMLASDRSGDEMVKVLDFGIAKIAEREADSRLTTVGTLGTPGYAAPEQLRAEAVDGRTDLFAFGVILYGLLTGHDPWLGHKAHASTTQIYELMVATDRAEVRPMSGTGAQVPPPVEEIVLKLLRRDPAERFQSARELREALLQLDYGAAATTGAKAPAKTATKVSPKPAAKSATTPAASSRGKAARLAAAVIVLVAAAVTMYARPWGRTLDVDAFWTQVDAGKISAVWLTDGGMEGGLQFAPIASLQSPFFVELTDEEMVTQVERLRGGGLDLDVSYQVMRLTQLAVEAQERNLYFGAAGADVQSYALQLKGIQPESSEAASLLLKVGERMAWDAEAARSEGPPGRAEELVQACLRLVPDHPRCTAAAGAP